MIVEARDSGRAICSTRPRRTEIIIEASSVSLNTMKKIGTENRFFVIASYRSWGWYNKGGSGRGNRDLRAFYAN